VIPRKKNIKHDYEHGGYEWKGYKKKFQGEEVSEEKGCGVINCDSILKKSKQTGIKKSEEGRGKHGVKKGK